MTTLPCSEQGCNRSTKARGLCMKHYSAQRRSGLQLMLDTKPTHRLSEVDTHNATAVCEVCGPVAIRIRGGGRGHECRTMASRRRGRGSAWRSAIQSRYGLTAEDYLAMHEEQNGLCAICGQPSSDGTRLAVDHDHETGKVRQLLCRSCNMALGFLRDSPETARRATEYLIRHAP
jgi:hypothetical protein